MQEEAVGYKLLLPHVSGPRRPERWQLVCSHLFGLKEREAERLWKHLPVHLPLAPMTMEEQKKACHHLEHAGLKPVFTPTTGTHPLCVKHPAIVRDEPCPQCRELQACLLCLKAEPSGLCPDCTRRWNFRRRFRAVRISVLAVILILVVLSSAVQDWRIHRWNMPLRVGIYPVVGQDVEEVSAYVRQLKAEDFQPFVDFLQTGANEYGLKLSPIVEVRVAPTILEQPPANPRPMAAWNEIAAWSLSLRYWVMQTRYRYDLPTADVRVFVVYYQDMFDATLDHSVGLQKGHIGIVHAFQGDLNAPMTHVAAHARAMEAEGRALSVSYFPVQPWLDMADVCLLYTSPSPRD
mgnify:CR=1 FL=1